MKQALLVRREIVVGIAADARKSLGCLHDVGEGTENWKSSLLVITNGNLVIIGQIKVQAVPVQLVYAIPFSDLSKKYLLRTE